MSLLQNSNAISAGGAYNITDSLRFRSSASAYLSRTPASAGNRKTWTWSAWIKRGIVSGASGTALFSGGTTSGDTGTLNCLFNASDKLIVSSNVSTFRTTTQVFRDTSAWYHIVLAVDTTQATANDRIKLYVNGNQVTAFDTTNNPTQNNNTGVNNTEAHDIGRRVYSSDLYHDGYMTEVNFVDGQALTASDFGETNADGVWSPKKYTGSYGTNGFYLPMKDFGLSISSTSGPGFSTYAGSFDSGLGTTGTDINLPNNSTNLAIGTNDFTIEGWVYTTKNGRGSLIGIGSVNTTGSLWFGWEDNTTSYIRFGPTDIITSGLSLSSSGWVHIALTRSGSTVRLYKNGSLINSATSSANLNLTDIATIGHYGSTTPSSYTLQGQLSNVRLVVGTALYTGSTYTVPTSALTAVTGTQLLTLQDSTLKDNSSNNYSMTVIYPYTIDASGNSNSWKPVSINLYDSNETTYDLMSDTPSLADEDTGNFATLNPLVTTVSGTSTITNGNLTLTGTSSNGVRCSTIGVSSDKWYAEITLTANPSNSDPVIGVVNANNTVISYPGQTSDSYGIYCYPSNTYLQKVNNGTFTNTNTTTSTTGNIISVAIDVTNNKIWFAKNGVWTDSGNPATATNPAFTISSGTYYFAARGSGGAGTAILDWNFGQRPFKYTPPTGYKKLNTFNLPDSSITDGSQYMNTVLYTGNFTTNTNITGVGFSPDLVWIKCRSFATHHALFDTIRGTDKRLRSSGTDAESTRIDALTSFDADGFTIGAEGEVNNSGNTYVAWNWRGSDSTAVSNTDGTITSTVSANTTSGFSVVTYTGTGANATVGHGLGVAPKMIIAKRRDSATDSNWQVWHTSLTSASHFLQLNTTAAQTNANSPWSTGTVNSTIFTVEGANATNNLARSSATYAAYCFAEIAGFSKFGSYTGNGSTDGPFIYTGFRPAFVLLKNANGANSWYLSDSAREPENVVDYALYPNLSDAESSSTNYDLDFVSNGFKIRNTGTYFNASGQNIIYMAFAENPFKNSLAR